MFTCPTGIYIDTSMLDQHPHTIAVRNMQWALDHMLQATNVTTSVCQQQLPRVEDNPGGL